MKRNGVFQAFLSPWRGPWNPLEINLQMPDGTAFISSKSGGDRFRNSEVIGVTRKNADGQTAFQLYIVDVIVWLAVVFGINSVSNAGKKIVIVQGAAKHYYNFHTCIVNTIKGARGFLKPFKHLSC